MTNLEINKQINFLNEIMMKIISPNTFTLNNQVLELTNEIKKLQEECTHNFVDEYCEYCYKEKTNEETQN